MNDLQRQKQLNHIRECITECDKKHSREEIREAEKHLGVFYPKLIPDLFEKAA